MKVTGPSSRGIFVCLALLLAPALFLPPTDTGAGNPIATEFEREWTRTDSPVAHGIAGRSWTWGPSPITGVLDDSAGLAPPGVGASQYYDKARMELYEGADGGASSARVESGTLASELLSGMATLSDGESRNLGASTANVAGDQGASDVVSYALLSGLREQEPFEQDEVIQTRLLPDGGRELDSELVQHAVTALHHIECTDHRIASVFWEFMTSSGPVWDGSMYAIEVIFHDPLDHTGDPLTEAYWINAVVDGIAQDVLVQCFEDRCMTYTPRNPDGWKVESNNAGSHYIEWRSDSENDAQLTPTPVATGEHPDGLPSATFLAASGDATSMWLEVAANVETRQCGLMHRTEMPEDTGMLFVFESEQLSGFWNCNTFIPLTLAWIDGQGVILGFSDMEAQVQGQPQQPVTYSPPGPYRFVIEANQGWYAENGVAVGDRVDLEQALQVGDTGSATLCREFGLDCG